MNGFPILRSTLVLAMALASTSRALIECRSTQGVDNDAPIEILRASVRASVGEAWVDVEEEVVVKPGPRVGLSLGEFMTDTDTWEVYGEFQLPKGAVLVGAFVWDGNRPIKARLKARSVPNTSFQDAVIRPLAPAPGQRDPIVIEYSRESDIYYSPGSIYSLRIYPIVWGGSRRFRLRYLVPLHQVGSAWEAPLGSAFANNVVVSPSSFEFQWSRPEGSKALLVRDGAMEPPSGVPSMVPVVPDSWKFQTTYNAPLAVRVPFKGAYALTTRFDSTTWKGGYILFRGSVPDSVLKRSDLRQEYMVLWRWSQPGPLAIQNERTTYLTTYGEEVVRCAASLRASLVNLARASRSVRVGMVIDEGAAPTRNFPLSAWESDTFARMQDHLATITPQELLRGAILQGAIPKGEVDSAAGRRAGARAFAADLQQVFSMYSPDSGVVRHLIVVAAGPAEDIAASDVSLPAWPANLTLSTWNPTAKFAPGHWEGVDLRALEREHGLAPERSDKSWLPFAIPSPPWQWRLEFEAGAKTFDQRTFFGLGAVGTRPVSAALHAPEPWKHKATWKLYDQAGNLKASQTSTDITWIDLPNDTAVAMLYANADGHWSEEWGAAELGSVFGFLDRSHSMLALRSDTLGKEAETAFRNQGVPFLLGSEIFSAVGIPKAEIGNPIDSKPNSTLGGSKGLQSLAVSTLGSHLLKIALPAKLGASAELVIRDLRGKVIARWSAAQLTGSVTLEWRIPAALGRTVLIVELHSGAERVTRSVMTM